MVHALERAREHLVPGGVLICIQPRRLKRPFIALTASGQRRPVARLINPASERLLSAAEAAIETVVTERLLVRMGKRNHEFRVRIANPNQLDRYLHSGQRPPRFPAGARSRFRSLWRSRTAEAQIEVTEYLTVIAMRAAAR
jgi:hypothetical protein